MSHICKVHPLYFDLEGVFMAIVTRLRIIFECLLQVILFGSIGYSMYIGNYPNSPEIKVGFVVVVVIINYLLRKKIDNKWTYVAIQPVFLVGGILVGLNGRFEEAMWLMIVALVVVIYSVIVKFGKIGEGFPMAIVLVFPLEALISRVADMAMGAMIFFIIFYILYLNYLRMEKLFEVNEKTSNFPDKKIIKTNATVLAGVLALLGMNLLTIYGGPFGVGLIAALKWLAGVIGDFLRKVLDVDYFYIKDEPTSEEMSIMERETTNQTNTGSSGSGGVALREFLVSMSIVVIIVIMITVVVAVVVVISRLLAQIAEIDESTDVIEDLPEEELINKPKKKAPEINDKDLNKRVRKLYKRNVKKVRKEKGTPQTTATAPKITRMFCDTDEADEITRIYEKARYSDEMVTKEEADIISDYRRGESDEENE